MTPIGTPAQHPGLSDAKQERTGRSRATGASLTPDTKPEGGLPRLKPYLDLRDTR
jgi:hypothetical protein